MADTAQALAFEEALRGVAQQQAVLDGLRGRATALLGVASISTSFLGGIALSNSKPSGPSWMAIGTFITVGFLTIGILFPRRGWIFRTSPKALISDYVEAEPPASLQEMQRDLALYFERHLTRIKSDLIALSGSFELPAQYL
jgi:hypothetical protein